MPSRILIVADDLTGANDSAAKFAAVGRAVTVLETATTEEMEGLKNRFRIVALSTESRNLGCHEAAEAARRVLPGALAGFDPGIVFKKIDSTLRGNIEAELAVCHELVNCGKDVPIILTPAYPGNGRIVCGGYVLVCGVPLSRSFAGRDALAPATASRVSRIFPTWRDRVSEVTLGTYETGDEALRQALLKVSADGKDLLLADATDQEDLDLLVRVVLSVHDRVLWAGSAGLADAIARHLAKANPRSACKSVRPASTRAGRDVLVLYGSLNPASMAQADCARENGSCRVIYAPDGLGVRETLDVLARSEGSTAIVSAHLNCVGTPAEASVRIKNYFAEVAREAVMSRRFHSIVLCGGDVGRAVLAALGATTITTEAEIIPGVVYCRAYEGLAAGMGVVTKAGGFGERETLCQILAWLRSDRSS